MLDEDGIKREIDPLGWAREYLARRDPEMVASKNLDIAYESEYIEAAAIVFDEQPAEFDRLVNKLKGRGLRSDGFRRKVKEAHSAGQNRRPAHRRLLVRRQSPADHYRDMLLTYPTLNPGTSQSSSGTC